MTKIVVFISKVILLITALNIYAWAIYHVHSGGKKFGGLTESIKTFSQFPGLVVEAYKEITNSVRMTYTDPDFEEKNDLKYDVYAVNAHFENSMWVTRLVNLRNDSTLFKWYLKRENYFHNTERIFSHAEPRVPIILPDTSLVIHNTESFNLYRIDANSEIIWHNKKHRYHHAINLDHDGNIWTCTEDLVQIKANNIEYWDNHLTKIDVNNGNVLYHKSLTEIFQENKLEYLVHGYGNISSRKGDDPLHLNEIEPVFFDGPFWNKGDIFISLRHRSLVFLYRPETNEIVRMIQGPFFNQHDVNILSDSTISLFNNNVTSVTKITNYQKDSSPDRVLPNPTINLSAEVLTYNMADSSFSSLYPDEFVKNEVFTETQGLHRILENGDLFVESYSEGKIYIFDQNGTVLRKYFNEPEDGQVENTHWVRIYENLNFLK